ncbi:MAG: TylF/MycF family methyltransferase [Candidatus Brocadia sinica]|uniref:TylF/MycF/NovP-related O-methyltransferase n=1 Tax=Candidatus Brocadia TaxID=380240 RepID=UPI001910B349|nr:MULTISPECIES: TylF/MycF/NovP-related O-methyltransferase [Brocadia]MCK6467023.1 TylF/MycF family methyltransferase [Candidatus Brocadia sinica]
MEDYFSNSIGSNVEKLQNFTKYVPTQDLRKFFCRYELFRKILHVHGSIVECGVLYGGGLMAWAQLSEIFEPLNHLRNIIGFDTFAGFVSFSEMDKTGTAFQGKNGGLAIDTYDDLLNSIALYNKNRFLNHIEKVKLVKGDVAESLPTYLKTNPHLVVSLLYLDFDIYEPTVVALKHLIPRIPKGGIIAFDELNHEVWPGETIAVMQEIGLNKLRIERFPFGSTMSYAVIE